MTFNSRNKGKVGEREAAKAIEQCLGVSARRGQQFAGGQDSPDVVADLPGVHIEVKRTECLQLYKAVEQAERDSGGKVPIVLHRRNRSKWLAIVPLDRLRELARAITDIVSEGSERGIVQQGNPPREPDSGP